MKISTFFKVNYEAAVANDLETQNDDLKFAAVRNLSANFFYKNRRRRHFAWSSRGALVCLDYCRLLEKRGCDWIRLRALRDGGHLTVAQWDRCNDAIHRIVVPHSFGGWLLPEDSVAYRTRRLTIEQELAEGSDVNEKLAKVMFETADFYLRRNEEIASCFAGETFSFKIFDAFPPNAVSGRLN